ncbi:MAG: hypothetical protein JNL53_20060, partial [Cyclobacteriaceae bacterium]|nr:hypothetical protein [Cyclobacteriaceae bacterium]
MDLTKACSYRKGAEFPRRVTLRRSGGQQSFIDNPFGGGLLAFVSGGGLIGAGGSLLTSLGGRAIVGRMATQALTNLTTTGIRSAIINVGVQWYVKGSLSAVDIFDVTVSAF